MIAIDPSLIEKALKFAVVGFSAFIIDFSTVYIFKEKVKLNKYIANTIAFIVSASYNFIMNKYWSFGSSDPDIVSQAIKFALSMTVGFLIATSLIWLFYDKMKINFYVPNRYVSDALKFNFYISKLLSVSIAMIWNFGMAHLVIFPH